MHPYMFADEKSSNLGACYNIQNPKWSGKAKCDKWCKYHWVDDDTTEIYSYDKSK